MERVRPRRPASSRFTQPGKSLTLPSEHVARIRHPAALINIRQEGRIWKVQHISDNTDRLLACTLDSAIAKLAVKTRDTA